LSSPHSILELYANRRTIRNYKPEPLAEGDLDRIIEAGRRAPSGALGQIYSVVRVTDADLRERLATLSGDQQHIRDAAEFFVFCLDVHRARRLIEHRGGTYDAGPRIAIHYGTMDALLLAANMATAAEALGYGTCFIGGVLNNLDAIARELQLPEGVLPVVGLTVGVPDEESTPTRKPRLPRELVFHENAYREPAPPDLDAAYQVMGDAWYVTLRRYFGPGGSFARREEVWKRALAQQGFGPDPGVA
jgi:FMN reductase (NADPH)